MDARERFKYVLARTAHSELLSNGWDAYFFDDALNKACEESGASEADARRALREMTEAFLLIDERGDFKATPFLALHYEKQDRSAAYRRTKSEKNYRAVLMRSAVPTTQELRYPCAEGCRSWMPPTRRLERTAQSRFANLDGDLTPSATA
ncbi:MAG: hypothetical protein ACYDA3_05330 [Gaiellaceae bacterium]